MISNLVNITDIFGASVVTNKTPIIVLSSNQIYKIMKKQTDVKNASIWEIDNDRINIQLKNQNLDIDRFYPFGSFIFDNNDFGMKSILLGNKDNFYLSETTKRVDRINNGFISIPISRSESQYYDFIGLQYENPNKKPQPVCLVPSNAIKTINTDIILGPNKFNQLSLKTYGVRDIMFSKFIKNLPIYKIVNPRGKYITGLTNSNKLGLGDKLNRSGQVVSYNAQGELIIDGKCITTNDGNNILLDTCGKNGQKWEIDGTQIKTKYNGGDRCLTDTSTSITDSESTNSGEGPLELHECTLNDFDTSSLDTHDQSWFRELVQHSNASEYKLDSIKGKTVVLVDSDDPWYVNKDITVPKKHVDMFGIDNVNNEIHNYKLGDFKSYFNIDAGRPDLGYGYSYSSRQGEPCVEGFQNNETTDKTIIFMIICVIILIILVYRNYYMNRKLNI